MTKIDRESVEQALAELDDVVRCRCSDAYTTRGMQDPSCECDSADAVAVVRAALDEADLEYWQEDSATAWDTCGEYRVKLLKAEQKVERLRSRLEWVRTQEETPPFISLTVADTLKGGKDER